MSEVEWSEEGEQAPRKKGGIPKWVWIGCGGGCLLAVVAVIALGVFGALWVKKGADPEVQWPKLQQVLPFEERPTDLELGFGTRIPFVMDQYALVSAEGHYTATVMHFKGAAASDIDQMLSEDPQNTPFGLGAPVEPVAGELEIQGQTVRLLRFRSIGGTGGIEGLGPGVRVDLSRPGRALVVEFRRTGSQDPLTDEDLTAFFDHFDVWKDG
jgi:hypothetical protein